MTDLRLQEISKEGDDDISQALVRKMATRVIQVDAAAPLDFVQDLFLTMGLRYILVVRKSKLVGIMKKKDLIRHIHSSHRGDTSHVVH